ncbi:glutathione peroxidase [Parachitinimonas caeni]|uniref:Glutathione peroxidase n=1 Tax=Parachitinimonas caeni TaxID=3031301 RepID=A0ABT7DXI7_9NEIS|nr:glutathione peroxidase [Parachitinimonas caeni]MDK2124783.1 glutathione peroxidase [Parachitinimonas caeni]
MSSSIYDFSVARINGESSDLSEYRGKVLLIVNTASECGFTPQYEGLESLYKKFKGEGLVILGFPCNQFGGQEPGSDNDIASFCQVNFGVTFPMFAKVDVNGSAAHPLFEFLKNQAKGVLGTEMIKWNFTKFLVNREGEVLERFAPTTKPEEIIPAIEKLL